MPIVFTEPDSNRITLIHNMPEQLSEQRRAEGVEIAEMPERPTLKDNQRAKPYLVNGAVEWEVESDPDPEGFMDALDVELGRKTVRALLKEYPDVERALSMGRYARAWAGLDDAREDGAIDAETLETIERLAEEYGIPKPDDG